MNTRIEFIQNHSDTQTVMRHLFCCDADFIPPLSDRVEIENYAQKIVQQAARFEALMDGELIGLVAAYCNDFEQRVAYITSVSVLPSWQGRGIAAQLITQCIGHCRDQGFASISLEVDGQNLVALKLYTSRGFTFCETRGRKMSMRLNLKKRGSDE